MLKSKFFHLTDHKNAIDLNIGKIKITITPLWPIYVFLFSMVGFMGLGFPWLAGILVVAFLGYKVTRELIPKGGKEIQYWWNCKKDEREEKTDVYLVVDSQDIRIPKF